MTFAEKRKISIQIMKIEKTLNMEMKGGFKKFVHDDQIKIGFRGKSNEFK